MIKQNDEVYNLPAKDYSLLMQIDCALASRKDLPDASVETAIRQLGWLTSRIHWLNEPPSPGRDRELAAFTARLYAA